jgi:propanediol dehydratase large subunit
MMALVLAMDEHEYTVRIVALSTITAVAYVLGKLIGRIR